MTHPTQPDRKTFKILTFGDSVLWGQGLFPHEKVHERVANALRPRLGDTYIHNRLRAHSGAIIGAPDDPRRDPPIEGRFGGEVPVPYPTIFQQVEDELGKRPRDTAADLVIVGGGINDVYLFNILNPLDFSLDSRIEEAFARRMLPLLEIICLRFPNAKVVVTGYYPFFSDASERELIGLALAALGFSVAGLPGVIGGLLLDAVMIDTVKERSSRFSRLAHDYIRTTVQKLYAIYPALIDRLYFADPAFGPQNAMLAPDSLLFGIQPDLSPQDPRQIADGRAQACAENAHRLTPLEQAGCPKASVGHPTPAGAQRYADAVLAQVRLALPKLWAQDEVTSNEG
jgi:lysophospholipase L1-like esterase